MVVLRAKKKAVSVRLYGTWEISPGYKLAQLPKFCSTAVVTLKKVSEIQFFLHITALHVPFFEPTLSTNSSTPTLLCAVVCYQSVSKVIVHLLQPGVLLTDAATAGQSDLYSVLLPLDTTGITGQS